MPRLRMHGTIPPLSTHVHGLIFS